MTWREYAAASSTIACAAAVDLRAESISSSSPFSSGRDDNWAGRVHLTWHPTFHPRTQRHRSGAAQPRVCNLGHARTGPVPSRRAA